MVNFIWIIGNLGSGKTTLCQSLEKELKKFKHFNVDEYRRNINKNCTMRGEKKAINLFKHDLNKEQFILLESIGTYGEEILTNKKIGEFLIIRLLTNKKNAKKRLEKRIKNKETTPFPYVKNQDIDTYMQSWKRYDSWVKDEYHGRPIHYSIDNSRLKPKEVLNKVIKFLKKEKVL